MIHKHRATRDLFVLFFLVLLSLLAGWPLSAQTDRPDFEGIITGTSPSERSILLLGRTIDISESTAIIEEWEHQQIPLENVGTGSKASVWGTTDSLGRYHPSLINLTWDNRIVSSLDNVAPDHFILEGLDFTLIPGFQCNLGQLSQRPYAWGLLQPGDLIATSWIMRDNERLTGNVVVMLPQGTLMVPIQQVEPTVPCVTAGFVTMRAVDWAQIADDQGAPLGLGELEVGDWIEVGRSEQYASDSLIIEQAIVHREEQTWWEYGGEIQTINETDSIFTLLGASFVVLRSTQLYDSAQQPISFDELQEGDFLSCFGLPGADSSISLGTGFRMIHFDDFFEVKDLIREIDSVGMTLQVGDVQVDYTDMTQFMLTEIGEIGISHLGPGLNVAARGMKEAGRNVAYSVDVEPNSAVANQEIESIALEDSVLIVSGHPVRILPAALIQDMGGGSPRVISLSELEVGQKPSAQGYLIPPDTLAAFMVTIYEEPLSVDPSDDLSSSRLPRATVLSQNYPNPFNPSTTIEFSIAGNDGLLEGNDMDSVEKIPVHLEVYDVRGRRVRELVNCPMTPGAHKVTWQGADERGTPLPSGVYLYCLRTGDLRVLRKMVLKK